MGQFEQGRKIIQTEPSRSEMIFEERQLTLFIVIPSVFSVMISVTKLKLKLFRGLLILRLSFILREA